MHPSLHLHDIRLWTGLPRRPWARSVTVVDGRVAALDEDARPGVDRTIDGRGRTVVPGLIDAHVHLGLGGRGLSRVDLSGATSREAFEEAIARRHARLPPDRWLLAGGWSEENWPGRERPDKSWLAAAGDRPVVCDRNDLHAVLVNEAVLRRCDLERERGPDWGGRILREPATGEPTGLLLEAAAWELVNPLVPRGSIDERRDSVRAACAHLLRHGLTAVGAMEYQRDIEEAFLPLRGELGVRCRFIVLDRAWPLDFEFGRAFPAGDDLAVNGYKAFLDGTFGSGTARMLDDYADDPGNRGLLLELAGQGDLLAWAQAASASGFSPVMHAIGDEANRLALAVVERVVARRPAGGGGTGDAWSGRPRIEHAQHVARDDLPRFAGVIASMQPLHKAGDGRALARRLGRERLAGAYAFRRLLDAGALLAFGSDWPVVSCDPIAGIRAAVTGLTTDGEVVLPDQNLTVEEALTAYTRGAAIALGMDGAGVIEPGRLGDLVVLDRDPFGTDWIHEPPAVDLTIVGGAVCFEAEAGTGDAPCGQRSSPSATS